MRYRRTDSPGGQYFFTVNLADRSSDLLVERVDVLRQTIKQVKQRHPFEIDAMVIMPEHLHAIWTLPEGDDAYPTRWRLIKAGFSRHIPKGEYRRDSRIQKGERGIWQRRYWEHLIRDDNDYAQHVDYIHYNPVKHGYVENPGDWPYSSIHRFIRNDIIKADWGKEIIDTGNNGYGER